jgi:hypothetical protein
VNHPPVIELRIDYLMEGEKKQDNSRGSKERNADIVPGRIHEYDFFLTPDEEGAWKVDPKADPEKEPEAGKGKKDRNKSTTFFLSE